MTDNDRRVAVEERLGHALAEMAATTAVSPDGLSRIAARAAGRRTRRLYAAVTAPALAIAGVVALFAVISPDSGARPTVTAGAAAGPARFAPVGIDEQYRLATFGIGSGYQAQPEGTVRVYGRRTADGLTLDAAVQVVTSVAQDGDLLLAPWPGEPGTKPASIRGYDVVVHSDGSNTRVAWVESDGRAIGLLGTSVSVDAIVTAAEGLSVDADGARLPLGPGGYVAANVLPGDFVAVYDGRWPTERGNTARSVTDLSWVPAGADGPGSLGNLTLRIYEDGGLTLDSVSWQHIGARRTEVGGHDAIYDPAGNSLIWSPRAGVLLVLSRPGLDEAAVQALAAKVRPINEDEWKRLTSTAFRAGTDRAEPPRTVIAEGGASQLDWKVGVFPDGHVASQFCVEVSAADAAAGTCGIKVLGATEIGDPKLLSSPEGIGDFVVIAVGKDVRSGQVEWADGTSSTIGVSGASADLPMNFLVVPPSGLSAAKRIVALDGGGGELARADLPQSPPGPRPGRPAAPSVPRQPPGLPATVAPVPLPPTTAG